MKITNKDKNGNEIKPIVELDNEKLREDLKYAGYNLMVTSELNMEPLQIYQTYHSLWKIEESFRITKSFLDLRAKKRNNLWAFFNLLPKLVSFKGIRNQSI